MADYSDKFFGQHEDERVLHIVKPHKYAVMLRYLKVGLAGCLIFAATLIIARQVPRVATNIFLLGALLAMVILLVGMWAVWVMERKSVTYITDRRIVRFHPASPLEVRSRSLNWDDAIKVKTYPPHLLWRILNLGNLVIHAHSSVVDIPQGSTSAAMISEDDVEVRDVYYYQDLGNYIDKVMYLYRKKPEELQSMRPFVEKPRGKRY